MSSTGTLNILEPAVDTDNMRSANECQIICEMKQNSLLDLIQAFKASEESLI